jgi:hypothetical protein
MQLKNIIIKHEHAICYYGDFCPKRWDTNTGLPAVTALRGTVGIFTA